MTCIIAYKDKKGIVLAGDKMGSNSFTGMISKKPKVFFNGNFMLGYTTSFRMGQLLQFVWNPPAREIGQSTDNYLYNTVTSSIIKCFNDNGFLKNESGKKYGGTFIMCYEDRILEMQDEFSFLEHETDIVSVGSGSYHATAAIQILIQYEKDTKKILDKAYEVVSSNIVSVSNKYDFITSYDKKA